MYIYTCNCYTWHPSHPELGFHLGCAKVFDPLSKTPTACSTQCPPTSRGQRPGVAPDLNSLWWKIPWKTPTAQNVGNILGCFFFSTNQM